MILRFGFLGASISMIALTACGRSDLPMDVARFDPGASGGASSVASSSANASSGTGGLTTGPDCSDGKAFLTAADQGVFFSYGTIAVDAACATVMAGDFIPKDKLGTEHADFHVTKIDSAGGIVWDHQFPFGGGSAQVGVDAANNVYLAGSHVDGDGEDFGGGSFLSGPGFYLAKFDPAGELVYSVGFSASDVVLTAIALSKDGKIAVAGYSSGALGLGLPSLPPAGGNDAFVALFDPSGKPIFAKQLGGPDDDRGNGVAIDSEDNVLIAGAFRGVANFGGVTLASAGKGDGFIAELAPSGDTLWAHAFGDEEDQGMSGIVLGGDGSVDVAGWFGGSLDFGLGPMVSAGGADIFLAKFDPSGAPLWNKRFGTASDESPSGIAVNEAGEIGLSGLLVGALDFGDGITLAGFVYGAAYIAKLDPNGNAIGGRVLSTTEASWPMSIAVSADGSVMGLGGFTAQVSLDGQTLTESVGGSADWVAKLAP